VYLALLTGSTEEGKRRAPVLAAIGFATGLSAAFVTLGLVASSAAALLSEHRAALLIAGGAVVVLFGAKLLGVLRVPVLNREVRPLFHRVPSVGGPLGGLVLGAAFGLGWTPCVGPVLGAVLTYAASTSQSPAQAAGYLGAYAAGLSLPLVAGSFAAPLAGRLLAPVRRFTPLVERVTGTLLILLGVLLATDHVDVLAPDASAATETEIAEGGTCGAGGCTAAIDPRGAEARPLRGAPRLVVFTSPTCQTCARMQPVIAQAERECGALPGAVQHIDLGEEPGRALGRRYAVRVVPTFLSLDANGDEVARLVGEQDAQTLARALGETRGELCSL
jgi:cytochrome c-type biogenesis protein